MSTSNRYIRKSNRNYLLYIILLILLIFPYATQEFGFQTEDNESGSKQVKRRNIEKKFKFRKIERIYVDDKNQNYDDDDDDDDDGGGGGGDDVVSNNRSKITAEKEFQFERAHKAHKDQLLSTTSADGKGKKSTNTNNRRDRSSEHSKKAQEPSFFETTIGWIFSSNSKPDSNENRKQEAIVDTTTSKRNGIIDWIKWLVEKFENSKPLPEPAIEKIQAETWFSYINRWPFNSLFPIGQPEKPIRLPHGATAVNDGNGNIKNGHGDAYNSMENDAMSQEHFESLLHTLPGFVLNPSNVADTECRRQLQVFHRQLRGNKLWTLQMLDATGKISSGLLRGNINQFGDFDMCTQIKTLVKITPETPMRIRGKYCLAHIEIESNVPELKLPIHLVHGRGLWNSHLGNPGHFIPRYAVANWGVCLPNMCSGEVIQQMLETNLRPYNTTGIELHVEVDNITDCYTRRSNKIGKLLKRDSKFASTVIYIIFLGVLSLISLLHDQYNFAKECLLKILKMVKVGRSSEDAGEEATQIEADETITNELPIEGTDEAKDADSTNTNEEDNTSIKAIALEMFKSFSPKHTLSKLISLESVDVLFPIVHLLKIGATLMLYICLKFLMIGHLPISNRDQLVHNLDNPFSVIFRTPLIYTDILLLISGFLSAYQLSEEMEQKTYIQLLKRMTAKMSRTLPTIYLILFVQTWILPYLGSGPLWTNLITQNSRICEQQMWRNVISVQNAIDFEETCSPITIQLALEVQLYLLGPLIVWLFYTDSDAGFFVYGAIHAMSVAARFSRTRQEHLSVTLFHGMNISKFYRTANMIYSSPIARATTYLIGIGAGILHRSQDGILDVNAKLVPIGWILAAFSIFWCFWSPSPGMRSDFIYTSADAASYAAWSPLILGMALFWLIFMFPKNHKSILRFLTTSRPILFISRITFPMQLVMYGVVIYNTASIKDLRKYHITDLINFQEVATIILLAIMVAFLIDVPSQNIRRLLVNRLFIERKTDQEQDAISGTEHSECDASEERSEIATCDTPEPSDNIWSSEPEDSASSLSLNTSVVEEIIAEEDKRVKEEPVDVDEEEEEEEIEEEEEEEEHHTKEAGKEQQNHVTKEAAVKEEDEEQGENEEEEEDETEIAEEDEVKRRPETPPPPPIGHRRRQINDD